MKTMVRESLARGRRSCTPKASLRESERRPAFEELEIRNSPSGFFFLPLNVLPPAVSQAVNHSNAPPAQVSYGFSCGPVQYSSQQGWSANLVSRPPVTIGYNQSCGLSVEIGGSFGSVSANINASQHCGVAASGSIPIQGPYGFGLNVSAGISSHGLTGGVAPYYGTPVCNVWMSSSQLQNAIWGR